MRWIWLVLSLVYAGHAGALACSPDRDYVPPTNFELVQIADAIIIARLSMLESGETGFELVEVLKGPDEPASFYEINPRLSRDFPSHPYSLQSENASNGGGSCGRGAYAEGRYHLLFYSKNPATGVYFQSVTIYGRDSEDLESLDAFWLKVVRKYLDIQTHYTPMEQLDQLRLLRRDLLDDKISPQHMSWIMDIEQHLTSPTPYKPMKFLLEMHTSLRATGNWPDTAPYFELMKFRRTTAEEKEQAVAHAMMFSKQTVSPEQLLSMINVETNAAILGRLLAVYARGTFETDVLAAFDIVLERMVLGPDDELRALSDGLAVAINGKLEQGAGLSAAWRKRLLALFSRLHEEGFWLRMPRAGAAAIAAEWNPHETPQPALAYLLALHDYAPVVAWSDRILADEKAATSDMAVAMRVKFLNRSRGPKKIWRQFFCGGERKRAVFLAALDVVQEGSGENDWFARTAASEALTDADWFLLEKTLRRRAAMDDKAKKREARNFYALERAASVLEKRMAGEVIKTSYRAKALACPA